MPINYEIAVCYASRQTQARQGKYWASTEQALGVGQFTLVANSKGD